MSSTQAVDFKFDTLSGKTPNTVQHCTEVKTYLVSYVDGEGKDQVRMCFRTKDDNATFVLQERINGAFVATSANNWFHKAMSKHLTVDKAVESI
jgi:hypothetical protein